MKNLKSMIYLSFTIFSIFTNPLLIKNIYAAEQAYIKVGEAQFKKSTLAFPVFNQANSIKSSSNVKLSAEIFNVAKKDLELSTYFEIMDPAAFVEDTSATLIKSKFLDASGFNFESWKKIKTDFLIRASFANVSNEISVEMYLYQVSEGRTVVGKKYKGTASNTSTIGHVMANDILEALTNVKGAFLSKIIATTDKSGHKEVVIMNWDGSDFKNITQDRSVAISPNWSPKGDRIVYSIYTRKIKSNQQNLTLFEHNLKTGKRVILSNRNGLNSGGSYDPEGQAIYLTISQGGSPDIYKINLKGDIVNQLTKGPAGALNVEAAVSPDGSKIAFSSDRGGKPAIYVMSSSGGPAKRITFEGKYNSSPSWSPDGKYIAFAGQQDYFFDIFIVDSEGKETPRRLTTATRSNGRRASHEDPTFSPDGRFIAYVSNKTGKNQIYVMSFDGQQERRVTQDSANYYKPKWSQNLE